jgi:hypothetical protein
MCSLSAFRRQQSHFSEPTAESMVLYNLIKICKKGKGISTSLDPLIDEWRKANDGDECDRISVYGRRGRR